ncbi:MAG: hypothetical protein P1V35_05390, partial [Planctomycetota bacterium]|nr:hypothetical protein [Planctomycetota bacterium]
MTTQRKPTLLPMALLGLALHLSSCNSSLTVKTSPPPAHMDTRVEAEAAGMTVQYLEIVSSDVDATCAALSKVHDVRFGDPDAMLGNARVANLRGGGMIGVRASMAKHDVPIVRPYLLVEDIEAAVQAAEAVGGEFAMGA